MQLTAVHDLLRRPGPFVTIHTEIGRPTEDARHQLDARGTTIRHALEHEGVDQGLIQALGERRSERPPVAGPARRTLVADANADEIVFDDVKAGTTRWPEVTEVGCAARPDRLGRPGRPAAPVRAGRRRQGGRRRVLPPRPGDWKQAQNQRSAENTWKRNAGEVADAIRSSVHQHRPAVVILSGDVRARGEIEHALEGVQVPIVHVDSGGRNVGASDEALWDDVRRVLAGLEAHREDEVTEQLLERTGQGAGAARGLGDVLEERADLVLLALAAATDAEVPVIPGAETRGQGVAASCAGRSEPATHHASGRGSNVNDD